MLQALIIRQVYGLKSKQLFAAHDLISISIPVFRLCPVGQVHLWVRPKSRNQDRQPRLLQFPIFDAYREKSFLLSFSRFFQAQLILEYLKDRQKMEAQE